MVSKTDRRHTRLSWPISFTLFSMCVVGVFFFIIMMIMCIIIMTHGSCVGLLVWVLCSAKWVSSNECSFIGVCLNARASVCLCVYNPNKLGRAKHLIRSASPSDLLAAFAYGIYAIHIVCSRWCVSACV